jgi:two-component system cell cycle sensor histidine kinase/response regulator CckA
MNGTLSVESAPGRGTTFKLYVPCADEAAIQAPVELVPAVRTMHGSETVMVVEDEPGVRSLVATVLKKAGYRVITAESAGTAMATLAQEIGEVHLVITDVVMPGGTGPELVNAVTTLRPGIKALFMSGYAEPALRQGQRALGQEFLQKPFSREQILAKVRESLDRAN